MDSTVSFGISISPVSGKVGLRIRSIPEGGPVEYMEHSALVHFFNEAMIHGLTMLNNTNPGSDDIDRFIIIDYSKEKLDKE